MAVTITPNLKLRIDSALTSDSKYNLNKLDSLGSLYQVDRNSISWVRSQTDIILQPYDPDVGGSGSGGSISLGTADQPADTINLRAETISTTATISSSENISTSGNFVLTDSGYSVSIAAPTLSADYTLTLPEDAGTNEQLLATDGSGNLYWATVSGLDQGSEGAFSWVAADGATKTITHGYNSQNVIVQVLDVEDNYRSVEVDSISRPTANTVILESSVIPVNWVVLLKEIL